MLDSLRPHGLQPTRLLCPWDFPGKNTGVGCHFLLQGGSSRPKDRTCVSCIAGRFFALSVKILYWVTGEDPIGALISDLSRSDEGGTLLSAGTNSSARESDVRKAPRVWLQYSVRWKAHSPAHGVEELEREWITYKLQPCQSAKGAGFRPGNKNPDQHGNESVVHEKMLNFSGREGEGGMNQEIRADVHTHSGVK